MFHNHLMTLARFIFLVPIKNTGILRIQIRGIRWGIPAAGLASVIRSHFRGMNL